MTSLQFLDAVLDWLLADPAHVVLAASAVAALTPTPDPNSLAGKLYRVIDILALNVLRAKATTNEPSGPSSIGAAGIASAEAGKVKQGGFVRGCVPPVIMTMVGIAGLAMLGGCTAAQTAFTQTNTQVVQAAMGAGKDELVVGRELICGAPYQVVANAMADDEAGVGTAVPALCPATKSVAVVLPAPTAPSSAVK